MDRSQITALLRAENPVSKIADVICTTGDPAYEALIEQWADAYEVQVERDLAERRAGMRLTRAQFGEMLIRRNLKENVLAVINAIEDPVEKAVMQEWYEYTSEVYRTHPRVESLRQTLGILEEDADEWFTVAMTY